MTATGGIGSGGVISGGAGSGSVVSGGRSGTGAGGSAATLTGGAGSSSVISGGGGSGAVGSPATPTGGSGSGAGGSPATSSGGTADPGGVIAEPSDDAAFLFDQGVVRTYNLLVAEADLAKINANPTAEEWVNGTLEFEGKQYGPLGVRYKGGVGSFRAPCTGGTSATPSGPKQGKCSVKLGFDHVDEDARFFGLRKLNFHSMNSDVSMMRDRLGYGMFREMGLAAPRAVHARLLINGQLEGLFALVEQIDGRFTRSRFTEGGEGNLYKEIWPIHDDPAAYVSALETNQDPTTSVAGILAFKKAIASGAGASSNWLDRDYMLRYIAVDRVTINDDGAFHWWCAAGGQGNNPGGVGNHNYYWYEATASNRVWLVPWDFDNSFDNSTNVRISPEWSAAGSCACASTYAQRAPSCDPLIKEWASWRPDYEKAVDAFLQGPFAASKVDAKLAAWVSQIQSTVEESAGKNGAPTASAWKMGVDTLKAKITSARASRGFVY